MENSKLQTPNSSPVLVELRPYSFRLPANGEVDPWFGCARTFWAERIRGAKPLVASFMVRRAKDKRGIRLIDYASARAYIEQQRINDAQAADQQRASATDCYPAAIAA